MTTESFAYISHTFVVGPGEDNSLCVGCKLSLPCRCTLAEDGWNGEKQNVIDGLSRFDCRERWCIVQLLSRIFLKEEAVIK